MLQEQDKVLVGVSGGADSVCLLFVLLECSRRMHLSLAVIHVNHGIRPDAAEDARYVEMLCAAEGIPFYLTMADVKAEACERGISEEEAGRNIRYRAFAEKAAEIGACKIAVAHNSNDRAETMLFHLFRGSDIKGLGSIRPVRDNIIRPILCLERREIEEYLDDRGISYCQDSTNAEDAYTRNRIRHHILPYIETAIVNECVPHITRAAEMLSEAEDYLELQTAEAKKRCAHMISEKECPQCGENGHDDENGKRFWEIDVVAMSREHTFLQKRILYSLLGDISGTKKDISSVHIEDLVELFRREGNRLISMPYGVIAERSYEKVFLRKKTENTEPVKREEKTVSLCSIVGTCEEILGCTAEKWLENGKIGQKDCTKYFDYDKIIQYPILRTRRTGDYLTIAGGDGRMIHKSLKDYMITEKIPRSLRDSIPVLAEENHVIWLVGYRISEYYKVTENTKRILQVELKENCISGSGTEDKNG